MLVELPFTREDVVQANLAAVDDEAINENMKHKAESAERERVSKEAAADGGVEHEVGYEQVEVLLLEARLYHLLKVIQLNAVPEHL